jgi:hypothetical protein
MARPTFRRAAVGTHRAPPSEPRLRPSPRRRYGACDIRNNLATDHDLTGTALVQDHNTTLTSANLATFLVDPGRFDLRLLANAPAVDTGSADQAPALDADRITRPQGRGFDLGPTNGTTPW